MFEHVWKKRKRSGFFPGKYKAARLPWTLPLLVVSAAVLILSGEQLPVNEGQGSARGEQPQVNLTVDEILDLLTPQNASPTILQALQGLDDQPTDESGRIVPYKNNCLANHR